MGNEGGRGRDFSNVYEQACGERFCKRGTGGVWHCDASWMGVVDGCCTLIRLKLQEH